MTRREERGETSGERFVSREEPDRREKRELDQEKSVKQSVISGSGRGVLRRTRGAHKSWSGYWRSPPLVGKNANHGGGDSPLASPCLPLGRGGRNVEGEKSLVNKPDRENKGLVAGSV